MLPVPDLVSFRAASSLEEVDPRFEVVVQLLGVYFEIGEIWSAA